MQYVVSWSLFPAVTFPKVSYILFLGLVSVLVDFHCKMKRDRIPLLSNMPPLNIQIINILIVYNKLI